MYTDGPPLLGKAKSKKKKGVAMHVSEFCQAANETDRPVQDILHDTYDKYCAPQDDLPSYVPEDFPTLQDGIKGQGRLATQQDVEKRVQEILQLLSGPSIVARSNCVTPHLLIRTTDIKRMLAGLHKADEHFRGFFGRFGPVADVKVFARLSCVAVSYQDLLSSKAAYFGLHKRPIHLDKCEASYLLEFPSRDVLLKYFHNPALKPQLPTPVPKPPAASAPGSRNPTADTTSQRTDAPRVTLSQAPPDSFGGTIASEQRPATLPQAAPPPRFGAAPMGQSETVQSATSTMGPPSESRFTAEAMMQQAGSSSAAGTGQAPGTGLQAGFGAAPSSSPSPPAVEQQPKHEYQDEYARLLDIFLGGEPGGL